MVGVVRGGGGDMHGVCGRGAACLEAEEHEDDDVSQDGKLRRPRRVERPKQQHAVHEQSGERHVQRREQPRHVERIHPDQQHELEEVAVVDPRDLERREL